MTLARAGQVRTLAGQTLDGVVSFDASGGLLVEERNGDRALIPLDEVLDAKLRSVDGNEGTGGDAPAGLARGVVLTDGTFLAGPVTSADEASAKVLRQGNQSVIPLPRIAEIHFGAVDPKALPADWGKTPSVLLADGQTLAGAFKGIVDGRVQIQSVIFGIGRFVPGEEAVAVALAAVSAEDGAWLLHCTDGSIIPANAVKVKDRSIVGMDLSGTAIALPQDQIAEISAGPKRRTPLLRARIEPATLPIAQADAVAAVGDSLRMDAGASADFALNGQYRLLLCALHCPAGQLPVATMRWVVVGDEREIYRSPPLNSLDDPVEISVPVDGVRQMQLRIESDLPASLGAIGLWDHGQLIALPQ